VKARALFDYEATNETELVRNPPLRCVLEAILDPLLAELTLIHRCIVWYSTQSFKAGEILTVSEQDESGWYDTPCCSAFGVYGAHTQGGMRRCVYLQVVRRSQRKAGLRSQQLPHCRGRWYVHSSVVWCVCDSPAHGLLPLVCSVTPAN
jgi:hypothetical protein